MPVVRVELGPRSYDVDIGRGLLAAVGSAMRGAGWKGRRVLLLSDETTRVYEERVECGFIEMGCTVTSAIVPPGETQKNTARALELWEQLAASASDRQTLVVAVGGGVVSDLAGFVAATYARGLPWCVVPTTLLAMVDAAIGGKTGVNLQAGKNLVGAFHQPCFVVADLDTLATLPPREYRSGLAEVIKYGFSMDEAFFAELERNAVVLASPGAAALEPIVARCVQLKAQIVGEDERETSGRRAVLNFGHTFAHAFETVAGYGTWLHGEAVAAGMVCASRLAELLGCTTAMNTQRLIDLLLHFQLPTQPAGTWSAAKIMAAMKSDKKAQDGLPRFVLPQGLGSTVLRAADEAEVLTVLRSVGCQP